MFKARERGRGGSDLGSPPLIFSFNQLYKVAHSHSQTGMLGIGAAQMIYSHVITRRRNIEMIKVSSAAWSPNKKLPNPNEILPYSKPKVYTAPECSMLNIKPIGI
jgi:hypothetical protein